MKQLISIAFGTLSILIFLLGVLVVTGHIALEIPGFLMILNLPSIALIIGGTFFQLFVSYPTSQILGGFYNFLPRIYSKRFDYESRLAEITRVLDWQQLYLKSKQNSWPVLKSQSKSDFESHIFELLETNYQKQDFLELAYAKINSLERQVNQSIKVFQLLSVSSPAFGMLGTIIGLLVMFNNFENNIQLASGIGLALMTTLYGIFFSQFIWIPASKRIHQFHSDLTFNYGILIEGVVLILEEKSSLYIQDYLKAKVEKR
jgi:chemotaxis protein MotA